jgi:hypothetical protein
LGELIKLEQEAGRPATAGNPHREVSLSSPVIASKAVFLEAKVSTTIGKFSYTVADVN